jgi:acetyl-CoA carboxylase carboxyl transferase subunit beta
MSLLEKLRANQPKIENLEVSKTAMGAAEDLWVKCAGCGAPLFKRTFLENLKLCDKCDHHHKMTAWERLEASADPESFTEWDAKVSSADPLNFGEEYTSKLAQDQQKTKLSDAILTGSAKIGGYPVALGIMDFFFRGGSLGCAVGEKIVRLFERAAELKLPVVMFTCSGGARMQEGMFSLMQLAKTMGGVVEMAHKHLPYIVVLTDPTMAGVAASYASVGDIVLAEPKAIIGFSGARVIEQTIRQKLPSGFQSSEFYLKHGFIDAVVHRKKLRDTLIRVLSYFS